MPRHEFTLPTSLLSLLEFGRYHASTFKLPLGAETGKAEAVLPLVGANGLALRQTLTGGKGRVRIRRAIVSSRP
ncbi:hypothetical protein L6452_34850 [Arctium lappa]|uniref:Uncharacterized protein n=1 Tax=Arctium lappa TaxID=4217 RepID=A0ACB8YNJ8_ARCLA|nr:hypothetical protein L6452_34850 [Arctium lappa]